jgi:hypothetical protein
MAGMTDQDILAFEHMSTVAESTEVLNLFGEKKSSNIDVDIHDALMVAGLTPVIGNIADLADAAIYAIEGEYGSAALSAAAAIPLAGQIVGTQKLLKKSGEKLVTLYRGVDKWHPGEMVRKGNFVGGGQYVSNTFSSLHNRVNKKALWVAGDLDYAKGLFRFGHIPTGTFNPNIILEFRVPESLVKSGLTKTGQYNKKVLGFFEQGLPKQFLTKVHKIDPTKSYSQYK